jgi:hypothetical protein
MARSRPGLDRGYHGSSAHLLLLRSPGEAEVAPRCGSESPAAPRPQQVRSQVDHPARPMRFHHIGGSADTQALPLVIYMRAHLSRTPVPVRQWRMKLDPRLRIPTRYGPPISAPSAATACRMRTVLPQVDVERQGA